LPTLKKKRQGHKLLAFFPHSGLFLSSSFFLLGAASLLTGCVIPQVLSPQQLFWNGIVCELRLFLTLFLAV
jgi:hypothetical protein